MSNKKSTGPRAKTRHKLGRKAPRLTIKKLLSKPEEGKTVQVNIDSSVHSGMPHHRFQGLTGKVVGHKGKTVEVKLFKGNSEKLLVVHPAHLNILEAGKK